MQQKEYLANFIKTDATPPLYYRPSKLTDALTERLEEQKENAKKERQLYEERKEARAKEEESEQSSTNEEKERTPPTDLEDTEEDAVKE